MTIQDLGSIGGLITAIATIATLFYLAMQVRQNARSVRASSFQSGVDGIILLDNMIAQDGSLAPILRIGDAGLVNLTEDERLRYSFM